MRNRIFKFPAKQISNSLIRFSATKTAILEFSIHTIGFQTQHSTNKNFQQLIGSSKIIKYGSHHCHQNRIFNQSNFQNRFSIHTYNWFSKFNIQPTRTQPPIGSSRTIKSEILAQPQFIHSIFSSTAIQPFNIQLTMY